MVTPFGGDYRGDRAGQGVITLLVTYCLLVVVFFILSAYNVQICYGFVFIFVSPLGKIALIYTVNKNEPFIHSYHHAFGTLVLIQNEYTTASNNWNNINPCFPFNAFPKITSQTRENYRGCKK